MAGTLPSRIGVLERSPWFLKSGQTLVLLGDVSIVSDAREKADFRRK
jgi:hypothetical protein